jgi:Tfp pilus assembly protein FimT
MMPTCTAPMLFDAHMGKCVNTKVHKRSDTPTYSPIYLSTRSRIRAFTLTELIVVLLIIWLFVLLAVMNLFGLLRKNTFRVQAQEFVSTMQMAANAAAESNRRYEVIIDLTEQNYVLREITSPDLTQVLEEEIIVNNDLGNNCQVAYVLFDDGDYTDPEHMRAMFRAGHSGWQYGGKIVLLDEDEQPYSVVVNRISRTVTLKKGDVEILVPKAREDVLF